MTLQNLSRGISSETGKWVFGTRVFEIQKFAYIISHETVSENADKNSLASYVMYAVDPKTISRAVSIYDGQIMFVGDYIEWGESRGEVIYDSENCRFAVVKITLQDEKKVRIPKTFRVIGNKFEGYSDEIA